MVAAGETLHVDLSGLLERVELALGAAAGVEGFVIGLGPVFSLKSLEGEGAFAELRDVVPGRFHVFFMDGRQGRVTIEGSSAALELGRAELTLLAPPDSRVVLIPEGADELLATVAARVPAFVGDSGRLLIRDLPAGRWLVRLARSAEPREVLVADEPLELDLR